MIEKNIYIYGAGQYGINFLHKIEKEGFREKIRGFIDVDKNKTLIENISVYNIDEFCEKVDTIDSVIIISLFNKIEAQKVAVTLLKKGYECYTYDDNLFSANLKMFSNDSSFGVLVMKCKSIKPVLPYLEFQVADQCNLNCKSCSHFSNLVSEKSFASIEQFKRDLIRLSELFSGIERIRLMGGEPLLNLELPSFVTVAREIFPYAEISIVTNGILISSIREKDWKIYKKNGIVFDVSQYPPLVDSLNNNIEIIRKHEVKYHIGPYIEKFFVNLSRGGTEDYARAYNEYCLSKVCHFLRNGRLYACPRIPMAYEQQEKLGLNVSEKELHESSIGLYEKDLDGWKVLSKLYSPVPACRICTKTKYVSWEQSNSKNDGNYFA